jgi:hypothetical protein
MVTITIIKEFQIYFLIYFLGLIVVKGFVFFLNDVLINEDKIDEI